jgi:hypothetical protein
MSLYSLHNVNLDRDLWSVTLRFDFLFIPNNTPFRDIIYVASYSEIDYIKRSSLPICVQAGVAVMYGRKNLEVLPFLQRLIKVSMLIA